MSAETSSDAQSSGSNNGNSISTPYTGFVPDHFDTPVHADEDNNRIVSKRLFEDKSVPLLKLRERKKSSSSENSGDDCNDEHSPLLQPAPPIGLNSNDKKTYKEYNDKYKAEMKKRKRETSLSNGDEDAAAAVKPFTQESETKVLLSKERIVKDILSSIKDESALKEITFGDDLFPFTPRVTIDLEKKLNLLLCDMCGLSEGKASKHASREEYEKIISVYSKFLESSIQMRKLFAYC